MACITIDIGTGLPIYYSGPGLEHKHLPALFYFALSGEDSLTLEPFSQPVTALHSENIHIFSFTLPGHGEGWDNKLAIHYWVNCIIESNNIIKEFVDECIKNINYLVDNQYIDKKFIAVAGLSRGAFIATHLAAADERIKYVLGFAPLTELAVAEEFAKYRDHPMIQSLSLANLADKMVNKQIRYYIGNRDERVGTEACFKTVQKFTEAAYRHGERSPKVELFISPSVGYKGHGTLPPTFNSGAKWVTDCASYYKEINRHG